jgi:phosphoenolpyruvate carboxylase
MLGYSDSNKDGGFFMANAALHRAQDEIGRVVQDRGIRLCFFHGRGGTVGPRRRARGAGHPGDAPHARTGLIRFTEQGEVISFRYALPEIAGRHLEQIVHATLLVSAGTDEHAGEPSLGPIYAKMATRSMEAYRGLIDAPAFWGWFVDAAPIATIAGLPIASRPVSRTHAKGSGGGMTFDSLRAIPWVFSWIQMRILCPGWYGLGTALSELSGDERASLGARFEQGGFLTTVFENAMQELARVRLPIAKRYAMAASGGDAVWPLIEAEFERTKSALLEITGCDSLLANARAIETAIEHRNPWTDVLNLIQIDLLTRARDAGDGERAALTPLLQASVNGIAAGMQSTG